MANSNPNKSDIEAVFNRLRTIPTNKTCFDCNSKNPTWASVTYGVFICIDCSAVHRGLGVHLTFVRSTQLDTNWTWVQLRQMQLGGNANAMQFFQQHNCITSDAQKKYNSRAAQLYRDKLHQAAANSLKTNPDKFEVKIYKKLSVEHDKIHIHPHVDETTEEKEVDFFEEHEKSFPASEDLIQPIVQNNVKPLAPTKIEDNGPQPSINFETASLHNEERKSTIGVRKAQPKKSGLGAKKGGLGATKVKTNFAELEREAVALDEARIQAAADAEKAAVLAAADEEKRMASMRLAYQDLSIQQKKQEEKLKQTDPKKAEQVERLGMGFANRSGVSHSVLSDMKTIEQENLQTNTRNLSDLGRMKDLSYFDDYSLSSSSFNMNRNSTSYGNDNDETEDDFFVVSKPSTRGASSWRTSEPEDKPKPISRPVDRTPISKEPESDMAQKKFGGAKAISSDQFFDNRADDYETKANLNRFQGSSSISSSDFFGTGRETNNQTHFQAPDLDDVRESVRQGVTKVAGKLSSLASGVMSSIQDRYGY